MKLIRSKERIERYQREVKSVWDGNYNRNIWRTTHQAGSEEKNIKLAKHEVDLFLFPTKEKCINLLNNKEINPRPTFSNSFFEHRPLTDYLTNLKECVALDYGCGSLARYTVELAQYFKKVTGIDSSSRAIEYCKKYTDNVNNVEIIQTNGTDLKEIKNDTIDFVFSNLVFQHVGNKEIMVDLICEVNRVLKIGGIFRASFWTEEKPLEHQNVYHGTGFSVDGYRMVFKESGFDVKTITHDKPVLWITGVKDE